MPLIIFEVYRVLFISNVTFPSLIGFPNSSQIFTKMITGLYSLSTVISSLVLIKETLPES